MFSPVLPVIHLINLLRIFSNCSFLFILRSAVLATATGICRASTNAKNNKNAFYVIFMFVFLHQLEEMTIHKTFGWSVVRFGACGCLGLSSGSECKKKATKFPILFRWSNLFVIHLGWLGAVFGLIIIFILIILCVKCRIHAKIYAPSDYYYHPCIYAVDIFITRDGLWKPENLRSTWISLNDGSLLWLTNQCQRMVALCEIKDHAIYFNINNNSVPESIGCHACSERQL